MGDIDTSTFRTIVLSLVNVMQGMIVPILIGVGVVIFMTNIIRYVVNADNPEMRRKSREYMLYSFIALFLIFSVWGVIAILRETVGVQNPLPLFPEPGSASSSTVNTQTNPFGTN